MISISDVCHMMSEKLQPARVSWINLPTNSDLSRSGSYATKRFKVTDQLSAMTLSKPDAAILCQIAIQACCKVLSVFLVPAEFCEGELCSASLRCKK